MCVGRVSGVVRAIDGGSPVGVSQAGCQEPEGIMEQEQQYLAALETAATYKITGLAMEMRTSEGALVANFQRTLMP